MLVSSAIVAAVAVVMIGSLVLWSNPARWVNRTVFSCSIHIALWLSALHFTVTANNGLLWLRWTTAIAAMIPFHFWLVKEAIASDWQELRSVQVWRVGGWLLITACLAGVCFSEYFIPSSSTSERRLHGPGYYGYIIGSFGLYLALGFDSLSRIRRLTGGRRLALQVWLGGGCAAAGTILALMIINAITHDPRYIRGQPLVVLGFYAGTAIAITTSRIFDARQILMVAIEKLVLVSLTTGVAFFADWLLVALLPSPIDLIVTTAFALWFASELSAWLDRHFLFYPQGNVARQAAFDAARREIRTENLEVAFLAVLRGWGQSDHALVLSGSREHLRGGGVEISGNEIVSRGMAQLRWATPERLARERPTVEREAIAQFLKSNRLGVLVVGEGPTLTALVGVGVAASRRPFTYPQVTQLMELASIIESALERAHFSVKAQHAEQLATVGLLGASLAHEIRNPLVSIKTFVQLLPTHHHDPAFRGKFFRLIGQEVDRIDRLTVQLLELALPRAYQVEKMELHTVLRGSLDLVATKAAEKRIEFRSDFAAAPDVIFSDASAAKQVMLNLCFNAIQAVEAREGERWVRVATRNVPGGIEMAIADSGPGISEEIRPRLFQPFQSTKSTGFGLGLAICSDILGNLDATISVDPAAAGQGATFRVTFPCQPLSS